MPQVINPNVKKDDSIDNLLTGLNIASSYQSLTKKGEAPSSMPSSSMDANMNAMQRRLNSLNYQYADSLDKGSA